MEPIIVASWINPDWKRLDGITNQDIMKFKDIDHVELYRYSLQIR